MDVLKAALLGGLRILFAPLLGMCRAEAIRTSKDFGRKVAEQNRRE